MTILVLQHVAHETLGTVEGHLQRAGLSWRYVELFREIPETLPLETVAGIIVLGGPMNVDQTDRYPFLAREIDWLREVLDRSLPVLGICLGAQLLARSLGAEVYPNHAKEIGWYDIQLTEQARTDALFRECDPMQRVFQWHGDTFDLPDGAVPLAKSSQCANQAFRWGSAAWGLQFHVEMTRNLVDLWFEIPENQAEVAALDHVDPVAIRSAAPAEIECMERLGDRILARFATLCAGR